MEVTASRTRRPLLEAPDTILLGVASRPPLPAYAAPADVRTADDLPTRLFFGDLDQYTQSLKALAARLGAQYAPAPEGAYYIGGFPDGPLGTILVPLHPLTLPDAVDWFHDVVMPSGTICFGAALRWVDETYYRTGGAPDVERDVDYTPQQALQEGALAAYSSILTGREGYDLYVQRILYGLELHVPYRDLEFVLTSLAEAGLLRGPEPPPEWRPVVLPTVVACTTIERRLELVRAVDRETSAWLPSSEWTWRLDAAEPVVRDAAREIAVMVQFAWMKEVLLLERDAPPLARVDSPEPPFRFIAFT